jgi:tRNA A-37 threonylcarbamoyl transferase component Bud32
VYFQLLTPTSINFQLFKHPTHHIVFAEGCKLLQAAALGDTRRVEELLLRRPAHTFFRDYDRRTALHVAASEGKLDVIKVLVEKFHAPVNRSDRWGGSPLDDSHRHRHVDVSKYLREKGATTGSADRVSNLISAAAEGDLDELTMLLSAADDTSSFVNDGDYDGRTALHIVSSLGNAQAIALLLSHKADPNAMDHWGGQPLDDAIRKTHLECIKLLKEHGAKTGKGSGLHAESKAKFNSSFVVGKEDENLRTDFSELDMIDKIGAGAFGEIYKCRWRGTLVAAKCIKSTKIVKLWHMNDAAAAISSTRSAENGMSQAEMEDALNDFRLETSILRTLRHPNICMLLAYSQTENFEVMISELMRCSLLDVFKAHSIQQKSLPRKKQILYAMNIAQGMNYLHNCKPPIIHRDLKPANLLIDFSGIVKISDFGLAKVRPDPETSKANETDQFQMTGETGSYRFMAPEVFRHEEYNETVDVYAFAMIFYYLVTGRPPWETKSGIDAAIKAAVEGDRPIVHRHWDSQISNLMQRCWDEKPSLRPPFSVVLEDLTDYWSKCIHLHIWKKHLHLTL